MTALRVLLFSVVAVFLLPGVAYAEDKNTIGCILVNEGYIADQSGLLKSNPVSLSQDTAAKKTIFSSPEIEITVGTASLLNLELSKPVFMSFAVEVSQPNTNAVMVKSSPRTSNKQDASVHLTLTSGKGQLTIDCNARI